MKKLLCSAAFIAAGAQGALAAEGGVISGVDTGFILVCAALVMIMTPGVALFYGGLVRTKNVLNTIMQCIICMGVVTVIWVLYGYSFAFGTDHGGLIGGFDFIGLSNVSMTAGEGIPDGLFMVFQCMFAMLTCAIATGSFAERMRFPAFVLFIILWVTFVYSPVAHWAWGGGWMDRMGVLDFAGGTVVHVLSGVSGLVIALMIGKRRDYNRKPLPPHHLPMATLGAAILWFGWFGFNAGSALGVNGIAVNAFVVTQFSAGAGVVGWVATEWVVNKKPSLLGAICGCLAGLVGITPAAGFVGVLPSIIIGLSTGMICFWAVSFLKTKMGYDDSLDAFGVHGIGGIWGSLCTGVFASTAINPDGANGLLYGNFAFMGIQVIGVAATVVFAVVMSVLIAKLVSFVTPLRVPADSETEGLDMTQHGESAYSSNIIFSSSNE